MSGLRIARSFELDPDYVGGRTLALLAKKGAGKSYTARVLAEEFWRAKIPFVLLDPMGTSWGLRAGADGEGEGIPVAIFGGEHGDAPLERTGGRLMADLVVDERLSMVLDMSELGNRSAERQFALDFLDRLYRKNRSLVHLLLDEADLFAPQSPQAGDRPLLGVAENIVRRGRNRGIGITLITQRPAVLNKDVLTQVDGLVILQVTGLTDRKAIKEWVKGHADLEQAAKVEPTLAGLKPGESWWWIPELGILKRVKVRRSRTFDSSPTQTRGKPEDHPKSFADVDMGAIEERMTETIERAKAQDPKELHARIRELERERDERPQAEAPEPEVISVLTDADQEKLAAIDNDLSVSAEALRKAVDEVASVTGVAKETLEQIASMAPSPEQATRTPSRPAPAGGSRREREAGDGRVEATARPSAPPSANGTREGISRPQQRVLDALAWFETVGIAPATRVQVAMVAGYHPRTKGFTNSLSAMHTSGLINYPGPGLLEVTASGRGFSRAPSSPPTEVELHEMVYQQVGPAKARILREVVREYPHSISRAELAERLDYHERTKGFTNSLSALRSLGVLDYPAPGEVVALPLLFLGAVR